MNDNTKRAIRRMTLTAILLALLIAGQLLFGLIGAPLSQYFVGSWVNLILALTTLVIGWPYALTISLISPFVALLVGVAPPFLEFMPFIALSNAIFILLLYFLSKLNFGAKNGLLPSMFAIVGATGAKVAFLYLTIVVLIMPTLPIGNAQVTVLSAVFSLNQIPTALIGASLAFIVAIPVRTAMKYRTGGLV
jgi:hypothetical protein